jgi:fructose-1,6-bisphosphatase II / sedoheptulose-1,7-bisphosphatase
MDRNLALEAVQVTEATALQVARRVGCRDERALDQAAIEAMRESLDSLYIDGTVVIGEGDADDTALLYTGQKLGRGKGHPRIDIALDPLEGATISAKGGYNALVVVAMAGEGGLLHVPPIYLDKIAVGPDLPRGIVDLDQSPVANLKSLAKAKKITLSDLMVCILDRPRHQELIATALGHSGIHIYMGIGGAPEGVLAAAGLGCVGGQMPGRLVSRGEDEKAVAVRHGISDFSRKYDLRDLAQGEIMFAATGVTNGMILRGVRSTPSRGATTHSVVMRSRSSTVRYVEAQHRLGTPAGD